MSVRTASHWAEHRDVSICMLTDHETQQTHIHLHFEHSLCLSLCFSTHAMHIDINESYAVLVAAVFYPLDVVKTHLQNQRTPVYKNEIDCLRKVGDACHLFRIAAS